MYDKPMRRRRNGYFTRDPGAPSPLNVKIKKRVTFSEVDPMAILWYGRYPQYFELANEELGHHCGMTYRDFMHEKLRAPIVQMHVDYFASPVLGEETSIVGRLIWNDGARMNIEYEIHKENGVLAATAYTVQMFITDQGEPLLASPDMLERCRERWRNGEFSGMQQII